MFLMENEMTLTEHSNPKYQGKNYAYPLDYYNVIFNHGSRGGITPISRRRPSAKSARTTQPTHIEIIEALRLCCRIASAINTSTSSLLIGVLLIFVVVIS